jgi:2-phosphosulfolactate phosphatase
VKADGLRVDVVRRVEECPPLGVGDQAIVIDVLRATSAMAAALDHGVVRILPVTEVETARSEKARDPDWLLVGERGNARLPGFDRGNSPLEWGPEDRGRRAVWTTTNGTRALERASGAGRLAAAAFVNRARAAAWAEEEPEARLVLVPAGEKGQESEEDWLCCGAVIDALLGPVLSPAALEAREAFRAVKAGLEDAVRRTRHGAALIDQGLEADVAWAARLDAVPVIGVRQRASPLWLGPA